MTTHAAWVDLDEGSAPSTPAANKVRMYAKSDGNLYQKDDAGTETGLATAAAAGAMTLITDTTVAGSPAANVDFTSIPGTYKHLMLVINGRSDRAGQLEDGVRLRLNNDSAANYDSFFSQWFSGSGSAAFNQVLGGTSMDNIFVFPGATATANRSSGGQIWIPDYAGTTFHKNGYSTGYHNIGSSSTNPRTMHAHGVWKNTAAITRITLLSLNGANFVVGSRFSLYGVN